MVAKRHVGGDRILASVAKKMFGFPMLAAAEPSFSDSASELVIF